MIRKSGSRLSEKIMLPKVKALIEFNLNRLRTPETDPRGNASRHDPEKWKPVFGKIISTAI